MSEKLKDEDSYKKFKDDYGKDASWAIWDTPLSDLSNYEKIKDRIKPNIVMMGLNISGEVSLNDEKYFENFHLPEDKDKMSKMKKTSITNIKKLIYAFEGEKFEGEKFEKDYMANIKGAYMTDIIKFRTIKDGGIKISTSDAVRKYLRENPEKELENIEIFEDELKAIGFDNPTIIAFGGAVHEILLRNKEDFETINIIPVKHYSGSKDSYKEEVLKTIESYWKLKEMKQEMSPHIGKQSP
jgi:hypothetical protein